MTDISVKLPKPKYGQIVVLQKNGDEPRGHGFPLIGSTCVVGRSLKSDIRISSGDVSDTHCKFLIDEASGEGSLEILGNETEVNGIHYEPVVLIKLNHRDVILVGGRKLRFEYLPPDYKPISSNPLEKLTDSFNAEVVDMEENGDVVDSNAEKEEEVLPEVPCTPSSKRVSFGPYLSPEQFDNTLPPATPVKKGATPRRSTRYSGLKFTRAPIDPLIEEEGTLETPAEEQVVTTEKECIDETISEDAEASISSVASVDETSVLDTTSPSLAVASEFPEISARANLDVSSIDAMSTMSDVSNIAVVPSECCSFLDEPIEEGDFEVVEQEDTSLFADDLIGAEISVPDLTTSHLTNGTDLLRTFTTTSLVDNMGDEEEEGITLSPEDMSGVKNGPTVESTSELEQVATEKTEHVIVESLVVESSIDPSSPQADYTDVRGVKQPLQTPKPATPKADYTNVEGVKLLLKTPTNSLVSPRSPQDSDVEGVKNLPKTPKPVVHKVIGDLSEVVFEPMEQVGSSVIVEKIETPELFPSRKSPEIVYSLPADSTVLEDVNELSKTPVAQTPKADDTVLDGVDRLLQTPKADTSKLNCTDLEGVARLLETPKSTRSVAVAAVGKTPLADYTDVRGVKKLLQTPKPPPNTPKADYRDVSGVKRLLRTPKATPDTPKADYTDVEGIDHLMKTPKPKAPVVENEEVPEKMVEEPIPETSIEIADSTEEVGHVEDIVVVPQVDEQQPLAIEKDIEEEISPKETEVEKEVVELRRGNKGTRTPKTATPKIPSKRTPSPSEQEELPVEEKESERAKVPTDELPEECAKVQSETELIEDEKPVGASAPKRGRRAATAKTSTPKADYRDVSGVKRLLRTPKAAPGTPKADYSDVEGVDLLMKTPKPKDPAPPSEEKGKDVADVEVEEPEKVVFETASEVQPESSETVEEPLSDVGKNVEENVPASQIDEVQPAVEEETVENETTPPKRARRAAVAKTNTPKADYSDVRGVKRLLKTPKAAPDTPKADYSNVEGVDILMKTPKPTDPAAEIEEEEKDVVEKETLEKCVVENAPEKEPGLDSTETTEKSINGVGASVEENPVPVPQMDEVQPVVEEATNEEEPVERETAPPKRGRRGAAVAKTTTPKVDNIKAVETKRLLKTPTAVPSTPIVDATNVDDSLMKTPQVKAVEPEEVVAEKSSEKIAVETTSEPVPMESALPTDEPTEENAVPVASEEQTKESDVENETLASRRGRRAAPTPKTNTPKPVGRPRRKLSQSEPEIQPEVIETVEAPPLPSAEKEVPEEEPSEESSSKAEEVPLKTVSTPKRGRRAAAAPKVETPKAIRSLRGKRQSESDGDQALAEAESRPLRSKRRKDDLLNDAKLSLSPVVRLHHIDVSSGLAQEVAKVEKKRISSSSNEEVTSAEVKPVRRGRGRQPKEVVPEPVEKVEKKMATRRGRAAAPVPAVEEPIPSDDEMEEVEVKPAKKATRRAPSKQTVVAEKAEGAPEEKRRRGGSKPVAGLDDVEMLHEGKGHAADIHANHMPDEPVEETNEELPATTSSARSTRGKKATTLKVHFEAAAEAAPSPVRSTRSTRRTPALATSPDRKVTVRLERNTEIENLAAAAEENEDEEKVPASTATKRPRQKKVAAVAATTEADESPAVSSVKRTRGGKKVSTESDVPKEENSSPPPAAPSPRRTRRTRNI